MSICLTWVPFCELGEPKLYHNLEDFTRMRDFTWRVSDCEKNLWGLLTGDDGVDGVDFTWRVVNMNLLLKNRQTNRQH